MPLQMELITHMLRECDLFLSIGTSGNVYPPPVRAGVRAQGRGHTVSSTWSRPWAFAVP